MSRRKRSRPGRRRSVTKTTWSWPVAGYAATPRSPPPNEKMAEEALLVLSTFPDAATARRIGRALVEEKCAACANLLPPVESIYWWEGKIENANETIVLFKTTAERYPA